MGADGTQGKLEFDYLAAEVRDARIAMRASLLDLKASLLTKADPRELAREHPRIAVGLAAAAGVAAGAALGARRGRGTTSAVAPLVPPAAQTPPPPDTSSHDDGRRPGPTRAARGKFATWLLGTIQGALGGAFRLAIESALASWAAAAAQGSQDSTVQGESPCGACRP